MQPNSQASSSHPKTTWLSLASFVAFLTLFYFVNRPAYRGYFSEDDLSTLSWAPIAGNDTFYTALFSPKLSTLNFRPAASLYYRYLSHAFWLRYPPYVVVLQLFHVLNVILLFSLLRRLGFDRFAAWIAMLFYAFNATVMEAYWRPRYVFDLMCATFCLLALLLYVRRHWIAALIPFWLAYKSKEIAVMLPVALLAYEYFLGQRKWKRLIPYFLISLSFGVQALWQNRSAPEGTYSLHFTPASFLAGARFYSNDLFHLPDLWVALLLLPLLVRDRRVWFGVAFMLSLLVPLLVLSNRQLDVYWYVPMIGLGTALAAVVSRTPRWVIAALFVLWFPLNYRLVRDTRRDVLTEGTYVRDLVAALQKFARQIPPVRGVVFDNLPPHVGYWGTEGAIRVVFGYGVEPAYAQNPSAKEAMARVPMALISFSNSRPLTISSLLRARDGLESYLRFQGKTAESQLGAGWTDFGSSLRWIEPRAQLTLYRPADANEFEIVAAVPEWSLKEQGPSKVTVAEDGKPLGETALSQAGQTLRWKLGASEPGDKQITIVSSPPRHGGSTETRTLGIAVSALGYVSR